MEECKNCGAERLPYEMYDIDGVGQVCWECYQKFRKEGYE